MIRSCVRYPINPVIMDAAMKPCFEFSSSLCVCAGLVHVPGIPRITTESKRPWQCFNSLFRVENDKKIVSFLFLNVRRSLEPRDQDCHSFQGTWLSNYQLFMGSSQCC